MYYALVAKNADLSDVLYVTNNHERVVAAAQETASVSPLPVYLAECHAVWDLPNHRLTIDFVPESFKEVEFVK